MQWDREKVPFGDISMWSRLYGSRRPASCLILSKDTAYQCLYFDIECNRHSTQLIQNKTKGIFQKVSLILLLCYLHSKLIIFRSHHWRGHDHNPTLRYLCRNHWNQVLLLQSKGTAGLLTKADKGSLWDDLPNFLPSMLHPGPQNSKSFGLAILFFSL